RRHRGIHALRMGRCLETIRLPSAARACLGAFRAARPLPVFVQPAAKTRLFHLAGLEGPGGGRSGSRMDTGHYPELSKSCTDSRKRCVYPSVFGILKACASLLAPRRGIDREHTLVAI